MKKIAIVTDSNSGLTQDECKNTDIYMIPMPFLIDNQEYFEEINLSQDEFYNKLKDNSNISTSQPSPFSITELWDKLLKEYEAIIHIPMSSGLSESCNSAKLLAQNYNNVFVVDNQRISVTQKQSVLDAQHLATIGNTAQEIVEYLNTTKQISSIYVVVGTLKYLKRGGRITPAAAAIGSLLNIKPILQIHGQKLDAYAKTLSIAQAKSKIIAAIKNDLNTVFQTHYQNGQMKLHIAHTQYEEEANKFKAEVEKAIPNIEVSFIDPLSLSVACHVGPGALALAVCIAK